MARVSVEIVGVDKLIRNHIKIIRNISNDQLETIAKASATRMQFHVQASIQRPESTGNLAESIYALKIPGGWGVGDITYLNKQAPYWRWINFGVAGTGRRIPPGTNETGVRGSFTPGQTAPSASDFRGGRFQKQGAFPMNPTKPITPHNFIARTLQQQNAIIAAVLKRKIKLQ